MYKDSSRGSKAWRVAILCTLISLAAINTSAQSPPRDTLPEAQPSPTPQATPSPSLERRFFVNILRDQRAIWTAPFKLSGGDLRWVVPLGVSTAALIATDRRSAGEIREFHDQIRLSLNVSRLGPATGYAAAAFYLIGRARGNARARETGLLGGEAIINGVIVSQSLKAITERPRPLNDGGRGRFFTGGNSFPSGHAIAAWSFATVVANEYGDHRLVKFGAYGLAAAVSVARYTGDKHFLSDVLIGSAIGYGIGRYVYRKHHDPSLDTADGEKKLRVTQSRLVPFVTPHFNRASHSYGLALAWNF